ncbi:MAG: YHYH protein [Cyclobacteriaceae bacterium]
MKQLFILLSLLFLLQVVQAHQGGHGHTKHSSKERTWHFANKLIAAEGTFLTVKDEKVFVENGHGILSLEIAQLSWVDQDYITKKTEQIAAINGVTSERPSNGLLGNPTMLFLLGISICLGFLVYIIVRYFKSKNSKLLATVTAACLILVTAISCGSDDTVSGIVEDLLSGTGNPETIDEAFAPYSNVTTSWDENYFYVASNGIPDHQMMVGITAWIAQVPIPQPYTGSNAWSIPLNTKYAENPVSIEDNFQRGAIGIAVNGIPIFNPINASGLVSNEIGELDAFGGHSGRGDDYHYHTAPNHLESTSGSKPIAYALDGYAVYGSTEPDGSSMIELDEYHGHLYTDSTYHYHGTDTYPYMIAAMRGEVTLEGDAPQNQVTPQPMADPPRGGDPHPINGDNLLITELIEYDNSMGYVLNYTIGGIDGSVDYSWDANDLYTFVFHDVDGSTTTETFQR